jgi:hypothetical protein
LGAAFAATVEPVFEFRVAAFGLAGEGGGVLVVTGERFCSPAALDLAGVGWDLGMEVVLGGTCFKDAAAGLPAFGKAAALATSAAFGVTGLAEELGEAAVLEAEGIDREPLVKGLETLTLLSEPIFSGAVFWVCLVAGCGFLEGIP